MTQSTIYPFGTGGHIPSNIGIINDLETGGADKALSAQQGVVLRDSLENMLRNTPINYNNGFDISNAGVVSVNPNYCLTTKIPVSLNDEVLWHHAGGGKIVEFSSDGTKIEYWSPTGTDQRTITISNSATSYIIASFSAASFADIYIEVNGQRVYTPSDGDFSAIVKTSKLVEALYGGEKYIEHLSNITWSNDNTYIDTSGNYATYSGMGYSSIILVPRGVTLVADMASGSATSAISQVDASGTFIATLAVGQNLDSIVRYSYTAKEDSYVILSSKSKTTHPYVGFLSEPYKEDADIIHQGIIEGFGDSWSTADFDVDAGEYMRLYFPNGSWETASSRDNYGRLSIAVIDAQGQQLYLTELCREAWTVPSYGYDFFVSPFLQGTQPLQCRIYMRANTGVTVPFVVKRLSQDSAKPYFAPEIEDTVGKIRSLQSRRSLTLAICTDLHYRDIGEGYRPFAQYSALGMMVCMRELAKVVRFDNIICLGDGIDGRWSVADALRDSYDLMRFFGSVRVPLLYTLGNHDDNRYFSEQGGDRKLTAQEMFSCFILPNDTTSISNGSMENCNWYRDIDQHKIRIIAPIGITLDGAYGFTSDTQTWFSSAFSTMPDDYNAIIITHEPMVSDQGWAGAPSGASNMVNIITSNIDKVICVIFGHTHIDNVYLAPYTAINIASSKAYGMADGGMDNAPEDAWFPSRAAGDVTEQLWDIVSLDQTASVISFIRFGAGVDRHVHYVPVGVSAGGTVTLTPSIITATAWHVRSSESGSISITAGGVVSVGSGATSGARLTARAEDSDGNFEYFIIKVE